MNRLVSLPFDASVGGAVKAQFGDRVVRAMQRVFAFGAMGRFLASGYLRSVDMIALFVQRASGILGLCQAERQAYDCRVAWRQWFEEKLCTLVHERILASVDVVGDFYRSFDYSLPPDLQEKLYSRLIDALCTDTALIAEMGELQRLPIGATALKRRLLAVDAGVERYMAPLAHDMVIGHFAFDDVVSGGAR